MGSQVHRIVDVSLKSPAFHKTEELNGDQPFLFLVDVKSSVVSAGIEGLVAHGRDGTLAGSRTYGVERRCRRSNRRTAQTMKINNATADIASAARLCLGFERIKLRCRA